MRGNAIKHASARLRGDKEIILAAIAEGSPGRSKLPPELQDDREFVLECVQLAPNGSNAIDHASARLRGDKEIILAAARKWNSATVLNLASTELQDDREVVLHCVKIRGDAIKHASARLRGDKEIILAAARKWNWRHSAQPCLHRASGRSGGRPSLRKESRRRYQACVGSASRRQGDDSRGGNRRMGDRPPTQCSTLPPPSFRTIGRSSFIA